MQNTYELNELLHGYGIIEKLRSQFVGTCLLALKNGLDYNRPSASTGQILTSIKEILESLISDDRNLNKIGKISQLYENVLGKQSVSSLSIEAFRDILNFIEKKILPYINDKSTAGQDLLNLFFITFNKYVGKDDKNQAFTPDHITDFMAKVCGVNKSSIVLDPCCGSGSFLVRAMTIALDDCATAKEQSEVKKNHIFGIEYSQDIFGLATTNMLIHGDGNSNIHCGNCFELEDVIKSSKPTVVLMNPPYNASKAVMPNSFTRTWGNAKEDPTKGFYFVKYILDILNKNNNKATVAVLLPVACAIGGNKKLITNIKSEILEENALKAVFSLPGEIFYPGASASACCMVFETCQKNNTNGDTFFGYFRDDGFRKRKYLGRVESVDENGNSTWTPREELWLDLYRNKKVVDGLSATHKVNGNDEWLCEAYMETDYSKLCDEDFQQTVNDYLAYLVKNGERYED